MRILLDPKTPNEEKDYGKDWSGDIGADVTIESSSWSITSPIVSPQDLEIVTDSIDGQSTVVRLRGGEAGQDYTVVNIIETSDGEVLEKAIEVRVRNAGEVAGIY